MMQTDPRLTMLVRIDHAIEYVKQYATRKQPSYESDFMRELFS
jgi:hypothetical protein